MSDVLGGMPTYRAQVGVQTPGIVQVPGGEAYGALAQSMDRLSRAFNDIAEPIVQAQSQREGRAAVEFGEDGRPRAPQLRSDMSSAGRTFNAAAVQSYQDSSEMYWSTQFQTLRAQHRDDPQAFMTAGRAMIEGASQQMPEQYRGQITGRLMQVLQAHTRGVTADMQQRVERQAQTAWTMAYTQQADELEAYAVNGQIDSPEARALMGRAISHIEAGVRSGHLSPEMARLERENLADRVMAHGIAGQAERIAREQGVEAGERFLVERLSQADVAAAGSRAISAARAEGARRLGLMRQEGATQDQEIRDRLANVRQTVAAGGTPAVADLERLAQRAEQRGMRIVAEEFRSIGVLQNEIRSWQGMTLPQLNGQLAEAMGRSVTEGDRNETGPRIRMLAQMIQQRSEAFQQDPVGFVNATNPEINALRQRVVRGEATMADLVRAQDAAIVANGADPAGARVISVSGARDLVARVRDLPADQAAAILTQTFEAYGTENRARLWNDLRRADLPESLRPVALLLASPGQADALRRYVTLSREPDALRRIQATFREGDARTLDTEINRAMESLRRTTSGTGQDQSLITDSRRVVELLASEAISRGVPVRQAVTEAHRQVVEQGWRVVEANRGAWRVPQGVQYDDAQFRRATQDLIRGGVLENVQLRVPPGAVDAALTPDEQQRAFRNSLAQSATWRSEPDGRGAMLTDSAGRPVFLEDGRPFRVRFDEVRDGTYPTAAPRGMRPDVGVLRVTGGGYYGRLVGQESGGDVNARNPRSTATGLTQFINGTWMQFARENWADVSQVLGVGQARTAPNLGTPDNPTPLGRQVLALRTDPMLSLRATHWYAQTNAAGLGRAGVPVNDWTVALAHGVGGGAAPAVIRAAPTASVESALAAAVGPDRAAQAIAANPTWRTQTAGQFRAYFQRRYGEGQTFRDMPVIGAAPRQMAAAAPAPGVRRDDLPPVVAP